MSRNRIVEIALVGVLAVPASAWAHGGHIHKVMGTVASVQGNQVEIKATDGKVVMVMIDQKTAITRGKVKLDATALKGGERVSIDYTEAKEMNTATAIKLGSARPAAAKP